MVDLPRTPLDNSVTQGAQSSVSGGEISSAFGQFAAGMDELAGNLEDVATENAALEGQGAVYKAEDGKLKYDSRNPLSRAGSAFNRSARTAYLSQISMDARPAVANLEVEAKGNVAEFDKLTAAYTREMLKGKDPLLRGAIQSELTGLINSSRTGMIRSQGQRDLQTQNGSITARIKMANEDAAALARTGGTGTAEYAEQLDIIRTLEKEKVGNPLFAYSQAESDVFLRGVEGSHLAEAIVGQVETIYQAKGLKAAQGFAEKSFDDPSLQLSPAERGRYKNAAKGALTQFKAEMQVERTEAREDAKLLKDSLTAGQAVDDEDVYAVADRLSKSGDVGGALRLMRQHAISKQTAYFTQLPDAEQATSLASAGGNDAAALIKQFEGFRKEAYFDVNALRTGYGSDTVTRVGGIVEPVGPDTQVSRADADRDLTRRVGIFQAQAREKIGGADWDGLSKSTKAALTSVAYNYGSLPDRVVAAVRTGDNERIALAVEGLGGDNEGVNAGRRALEASIIRGGLGIVDPKTYGAMRKEVAADAKSLWTEMKAGMIKGDPLAPADLALLGYQLAAVGDKDFSDEVTGFLKQTGDYSTETLANMQKQMQAVEEGGVSADERDSLDMMRQRYDQTVQGLKDDPLDLGRRISMEGVADIEPIDFSDPNALGAGLGKNITAARLVAQRYQSNTVGVLTKNDAAAFKSLVATGDAGQAATAMKSITEIPDDLLRGTIEMPDVRDALIGASQSRDYDKYGAAMTTMDALYNRAPQEFARIFKGDSLDALQDWQGRLRYYNPLELEQEFKRRADPTYAAKQRELEKQGSEIARRVAVPELSKAIAAGTDVMTELGYVADEIGTGSVPSDPIIRAALQADYEKQFSRRFAATQNAQTAAQQTIDRLKQHWGPSVTNNGELMLHPPDNYYPPIDGSYDWIDKQLKADLLAAGFSHEVDRAPVGKGAQASKQQQAWPHMLIADAVTETEAAQGKMPSYRLVVTDPATGYSEYATDPDGKELSIRFDQAPALAGANLKYSEQRKRFLEKKPLFGAGGGGW